MEIAIPNFCKEKHIHQLFQRKFDDMAAAHESIKKFFFNKYKKDTHSSLKSHTVLYNCTAKKECKASVRTIPDKEDGKVTVQGIDGFKQIFQ